MGRHSKKPKDMGYVLYDVWYEDGTRTSNRKIPLSELDGTDEDDIRKAIEAQDKKIGEMSGNPRGPIKTVKKSAV